MTDLQTFNRLVGTRHIIGGTEGAVTKEWMEGRHFLIQRGLTLPLRVQEAADHLLQRGVRGDPAQRMYLLEFQ
ncbi:hypothetical protein [Paenibacillus chitinolyticus]|uniref:hypothetical protein n=1 Tax=Paenibacillus chitinolyticus TaxID=79263 RepID=UPI0036701DBB